MQGEECINWLKNQNLLQQCQDLAPKLNSVFQNCLFVEPNNKLALIGDFGFEDGRISPLLTGAYYFAAKNNNINPYITFQKHKCLGDNAEEQVLNTLDGLKKGDMVVVNLSDKLGRLGHLGKSFRRLARERKFRFVSTTSLGYISNDILTTILKMLNVDYEKIRKKQNDLKAKIDKAKELKIIAKGGTNLTCQLNPDSCISSSGLYKEPGSGGNLPAGEVFLAPVPETTNGTLVIDGSSRTIFGTVLAKEPITVTIENGTVTNISGGKEANMLQKSLEWAEKRAKYPERVRKIAEIGIGTNHEAKLVGSTIVDEKLMGSAHVAFGSNSWFGGTIKTIIHLDQVFLDATVFLDGKELHV